MPDPRRKVERRPDDVPTDWLTRQHAQTKLKMSGYLLREYIKLIGENFPKEYVDLGPGKAAYLSPAFVDAIETLHKSIESAQDVPGYCNRSETVPQIGCSEKLFFELIQSNPPDVKKGEMRLLRNRNSQVFAHYSAEYIEKLKLAYDILRGGERRSGGHAGGSGAHGPAVNRPADILAQRTERAEVEPVPMVELTDPERTAALKRVSQLYTQLSTRERIYRGNHTFENIVRQLGMVLTELQRKGPIPSGLDRLCEKAEQYSGERE